MKQGEIRCEKCVNWAVLDESFGHCHRNPPIITGPNQAPEFPITSYDEWCGEFRNPQMVVDAALPKPQPVPAYHLYNLAPSSGGDPQPTSRMVPLQAGEMLDKIRASLRDYPAAGGDVVVMNEVDRIVREAVEKAEKTSVTRTTCCHKPPVLYCSNCRKITISRNVDGTYRVAINTLGGTESTILNDLTKESVKNMTTPAQKVKPVPEDRCFCGGVGCNSCEPGGRG